MNPALEKTWLLKNTVDDSELTSILAAEFQVEIEQALTSELIVHDDFDADLWNTDLMLCRVDKNRFQLIKGTELVGEVRASAKARFWWDFPDSDLKSLLKKKIGLRAAMPIASLQLVSTRFSLRNSDDKIVVRGQLSQSRVDDDGQHYLTLQQMRGYAKAARQAEKLLKPLLGQAVADFGLKSMFAAQHPGTVESNTPAELHLTADMPTEVAVRAMGTDMIDQATSHVDGVVADIDTVFLHQFRVSVRKLRSLISLLKRSLPAETVEILAPQLSGIASKTSRLRDLDVFLLDRNHYRDMLPESHTAGLEALYVQVEKQRQLEKNRLARYFSSKQFQHDIDACRTALSAPPAFLNPISRKPVQTVARSLLIKRFRKIQAMSAQLHADSDDEHVHDIRKEFKKMRYLIEFFIELLPKKRTAALLKDLKKLQVTLGDFNDYCVQMEFLSSFEDERQIEMTKALSGLIAVLHHRQMETRKQVEAALALFFTDDMTMQIELAFGSKTRGESR
ncbi:CHAD domain-containing protein [Granulosicoccus sp. 3-233]|uniref:CHAD domain-containing protein n=1 Tax=Granulosicoccus sp. 3-233 TaxID=3417969 RepID=UPI003D348398